MRYTFRIFECFSNFRNGGVEAMCDTFSAGGATAKVLKVVLATWVQTRNWRHLCSGKTELHLLKIVLAKKGQHRKL